MVLFGLFFAAPMALIVAYSFWTQEGYNVVSHWTFANYRSVFSTPVYVRHVPDDPVDDGRSDVR